MPPSPSQVSAESILATLSAGRAVAAQLGAAYLTFDQQVRLHAALGGDTGRIAEMESMVDRRVDVLRARLRHPPRPLTAEGERVDDEATPRGAAVAPPSPSRVQRALGRADLLRRPEPTASLPADEAPAAPAVPEAPPRGTARGHKAKAEQQPPQPSEAAEPPEPPGPEPKTQPPLTIPAAEAAPSGDAALAMPEPDPGDATNLGEGGAEPTLQLDLAEAAPDPVADVAPPPEPTPALATATNPEPTAVTPPEEAPGPPPAGAPEAAQVVAAPRPVAPVLRAHAVEELDEENIAPDGDAPSGDAAAVAVGPAGVRAAGPSLDDEPIGGADDDDEMESVGVSAPGGGILLGFGARRPAPPPRAESAAPRLTDEEEPRTTPMVETPTIKPAGDDARIATLMDDALSAAGRGDLSRAIQAFADVLDLRHDRVDAHIGRGRCYLELGDYSSAMSDFQRAEDLQPERPDAHVAMGDLYFARKEYRRAIEFYDQAVELDGSHAMARCRRGISHYYRKNYRQAFQDLQRAYSLDPDIPNIRKYVQMAVKKMERPE